MLWIQPVYYSPFVPHRPISVRPRTHKHSDDALYFCFVNYNRGPCSSGILVRRQVVQVRLVEASITTIIKSLSHCESISKDVFCLSIRDFFFLLFSVIVNIAVCFLGF